MEFDLFLGQPSKPPLSNSNKALLLSSPHGQQVELYDIKDIKAQMNHGSLEFPNLRECVLKDFLITLLLGLMTCVSINDEQKMQT